MLLIVEWSRPWQWTPGFWRGHLTGKRTWRVWWGYLAFAYIPLDYPTFHEVVAGGRTAWTTHRRRTDVAT